MKLTTRALTTPELRRADLKEGMRIPSRTVNGRMVPERRIEHVWDPTGDDDPKNKQVSVAPLSPLARQVIQSVPIIDGDGDKDWAFTLNGREPIKGWSKLKARLDASIARYLGAELKPWQHRDLRRTAKTLMGRADVRPDISERCLAQVIGGVQGVYDKYDYLQEKREAFAALAAMVEHLVSPPPGDNVVAMAGAGRRRR
jgi:hypothetical protein